MCRIAALGWCCSLRAWLRVRSWRWDLTRTLARSARALAARSLARSAAFARHVPLLELARPHACDSCSPTRILLIFVQNGRRALDLAPRNRRSVFVQIFKQAWALHTVVHRPSRAFRMAASFVVARLVARHPRTSSSNVYARCHHPLPPLLLFRPHSTASFICWPAWGVSAAHPTQPMRSGFSCMFPEATGLTSISADCGNSPKALVIGPFSFSGHLQLDAPQHRTS